MPGIIDGSNGDDAHRVVDDSSGTCKAGFADDDALRGCQGAAACARLDLLISATVPVALWKAAEACAGLVFLVTMLFA